MGKKLQLNPIKLAIPILIIAFLAILPRIQGFENSSTELSVGILLDLLITVPLIYYFLIRKTRIPKFTIIYPFLLGLFIAGLIIPLEHQALLTKIKFIAIPVIEIGILSLLIYKVTRLKSTFEKTDAFDFYDRILLAASEVFPNRVGKLLATEVAVLYYLFAPNKKEAKHPLEFTYFKKSGIKSIIGVFLFLISVETFVVHLLVSKWNSTVAWVLTFIGIYTILQVFAILRSMNKRLIRINKETACLNLRYGFGCQSSIPFHSISKIEKSRRSMSNDKNNVCLSLFDLLDTNNTIIYLNEENTLHKIYGIEKKYKSISLFVDEVDLFVSEIEAIVATNNPNNKQ